MNIKRFATLVLVLFAAPLAAYGGQVEFTDHVIFDPTVELLVRVSDILRNPQLHSMTAPTNTRVDVAIAYPDTWPPAEVDAFLGELDYADARLHLILDNSHINWLTFPRLAMEAYTPTETLSPLTLDQVNDIRSHTGADRVVAIVDEYPYGGSAMLCGPYAVVKRSALYDAYPHEVLHTVCLDHNPETAVTAPAGFENNRAMHVCPEGGGDGFATFMTTSSPCGWYNTNSLTGPGVFYNGVELVGEHQAATLVLQIAAPLAAAEMDAPAGQCVPDTETMCLDSSNNSGDKRFEIRVSFETTLGGGRIGMGLPALIPGSSESGLFSFFQTSNKEMLIKVVNGCGLNDHFWIYFGTTTNVGFTVTVRDSVLNNMWSYENPDLTAGQVQDINALPCN